MKPISLTLMFQIIGFRPKAGSVMAKNSPFSPADFQAELASQIATVAVSVQDTNSE